MQSWQCYQGNLYTEQWIVTISHLTEYRTITSTDSNKQAMP